MPRSLDIEKHKKTQIVDGLRVFVFHKLKKSGRAWMKNRVSKRNIPDFGDTIKTLLATQEEMVIKTQVQKISISIGRMNDKLFSDKEIVHAHNYSLVCRV